MRSKAVNSTIEYAWIDAHCTSVGELGCDSLGTKVLAGFTLICSTMCLTFNTFFMFMILSTCITTFQRKYWYMKKCGLLLIEEQGIYKII